jgi:putative membrane protein
MLWVKTFHLFFVISWFAGIFYLPRLFVNHAMHKDSEHEDLLIGMERRLLKMMDFTLFFVLLTGVSFLYLASNGFSKYYFLQGWIFVKLSLVVLLILYHIWCKKIHRNFIAKKETHTHVWFRVFNEVPVFALLGILYLVIARPF